MAKRVRMKPVRYNAGLMKWYGSTLKSFARDMDKDVRSRTLEMFGDSVPPVTRIRHTLGELSDEWIGKFTRHAEGVSSEMATRVLQSADLGLKSAAKDAGFSINMQWTEAMQQRKDAIVAENVGLIKSIPQKYFTEVEGMVYRAVAVGGDAKTLTDEIQREFGKREGITRRRAVNIANDQIRKATSSLSSVRQQAAGITHGVWVHSAGQAHPRERHVKADGKVFKLSEGYPCGDRGQNVMPGEEINCSCSWRPVPPWDILPKDK